MEEKAREGGVRSANTTMDVEGRALSPAREEATTRTPITSPLSPLASPTTPGSTRSASDVVPSFIITAEANKSGKRKKEKKSGSHNSAVSVGNTTTTKKKKRNKVKEDEEEANNNNDSQNPKETTTPTTSTTPANVPRKGLTLNLSALQKPQQLQSPPFAGSASSPPNTAISPRQQGRKELSRSELKKVSHRYPPFKLLTLSICLSLTHARAHTLSLS